MHVRRVIGRLVGVGLFVAWLQLATGCGGVLVTDLRSTTAAEVEERCWLLTEAELEATRIAIELDLEDGYTEAEELNILYAICDGFPPNLVFDCAGAPSFP